MPGGDGGSGGGGGSAEGEGGGEFGGGGGNAIPSAGKEKGVAETSAPLHNCAKCGAVEGSILGIKSHKPCARCKAVYYCSRMCQEKHWKAGHKDQCVPVKKEATAKQRPSAEQSAEQSAERSADSAASAGGGGKPAEEETCGICLGSMTLSSSKTLSCSHKYHHECIEKLRSFGISGVCPMCCAEPAPGPEKLFDSAVRRLIVLARRGVADSKDATREMGEVVRMLREASDLEHADAQTCLGNLYADGHGVRKSDSTAVKWYKRAAGQGNPKAQCNLAFMYEHGQGVARNESAALEWYHKAADQSYSQAQYNLGTMYEDGQGVPVDAPLAVEWYRKAAKKGHADAQYNLGIMYANGEGVATSGSQAKAVTWFRKAAEQGHVMGQFSLGVMYDEGRSVAQDQLQAAKWYRKAAEQGLANAQYNIGILYAYGHGVQKDYIEALRFFHDAQRQGYEGAAEAIHEVMHMQRDDHKIASEPVHATERKIPVVDLSSPEAQAQATAQRQAQPPPATATATASDTPVPLGSKVTLHGLKDKPDLNGHVGIVMDYSKKNKRCTVTIHGHVRSISIKPENLFVMPVLPPKWVSDSVPVNSLP